MTARTLVPALAAELDAALADVARLRGEVNHAAWMVCMFDVFRYLIASNRNGAEKAERHLAISKSMVAIIRQKDPELAHWYWDEVMKVHDATQAVTNHLDNYGFKLDGSYKHEEVGPAVFDAMWAIARAALTPAGDAP